MDNSIRIIVINDEPVQGRLFVLLLEKKGYNAVFYESAESFLELEKTGSLPDLIITDLYMPGIDGWRLCRLLRTGEYSAYNKIPVLVVSSTFAGEDASAITADMGANAFLSSPFEHKVFYSTVEQLLKGEKPVNRLKILAVEDSLVYRKLITMAFEPGNNTVVTAVNGEEAEKQFAKTLFDVIIIDYHLPDAKGSELLEKFMQARPDSIIIMITSDPDPEHALEWMKSGAAAYARKPFKPEYIAELCRRARREQLLLRVESHLNRRTQELNREETNFREFFNNLPVCAYKAETEGKIIAVNNACRKILWAAEKDNEDITDYSIYDFYTEPEAVNSFKYQLMENGFVNSMEAGIIRRDGTKAWISHTARLVKDPEGRPHFISGTVQDITERKTAEAALKKSEKKYQALISLAPDYYFLVDNEYSLIDCSSSTHNLFFLSRAEFIGKNIADIFPAEAALLTMEKVTEALKSGEPQSFEFRIRIKDDIKWFESRMVVSGRQEVLAILRDITIEKTEEQLLLLKIKLNDYSYSHTLRESLMKVLDELEAQTGSSTSFYHLLDEDERKIKLHTWSSNSIKNYAGTFYAKDPVIDISENPVLAECVKVKKPIIFNSGNKVNQKMEKVREIIIPVIRNNKVRAIAGIGSKDTVYTELDQFVIGRLGEIAFDIVERKFTEDDRHNSEIRLFNLINNSSDVLILLDENGRGKFISRSMERITGDNPEELKGRTYTDFIHPDDLPEAVKAFNALLESKNPDEVFKIEYRHAHRSAGWVTMEAIGRNFISDPATNGIVISIRDISERKENEAKQLMLEDSLRHAQKMESIGTMAGGIAHDFNNLLQAISGYTQLLMLDKEADDPDYSKLEAINRAGESAARLVKQMLLFSRKAESVKITSNINVSVNHSLKIVERTIPKMIKIETCLDDNVYPVKADPLQIEQIILNLCSNASDAMPDGGLLRIETGRADIKEEFFSENGLVPCGKYTFLDVSDTGCGIDSSISGKIYDPFFTTKETGKGTGLGLSTVYGIVKSHGGFLKCDSSPDSGTVFHLLFPASEEDITSKKPRQNITDKKTTAGRETVMIVDDNKAILDFMDISLTHYGYNVIQAESGEEAIEILSNLVKEIDIVVLDINMPGMGGHKCLKKLITVSPDLKIIIASGYSSNLPEKELLLKGASEVISKPYALKDLLSVIRRVLGAAADA